jgi:hypothetical protein
MKILISVFLFLSVTFILNRGVSSSSYEFSRLEIHRIFLRSQYFGEGLGRVYKNRFGVYYFDKLYPVQTKLQSVFFSSLDPILIFFPLYGFLLIKGFKKFKEK